MSLFPLVTSPRRLLLPFKSAVTSAVSQEPESVRNRSQRRPGPPAQNLLKGMSSAPWLWVASLLLLGDVSFASGDTALGEAWPFHIINFNFETVQVTWNASEPTGANFTFRYRFRGDNYSQCPSYILQHGLTVGCVFKAKGDSVMDFSLGNGTHVLSRSKWISDFLKPNSPRDLQFHWHEGAMTVTCPDLPYRGLRYEVQHKSIFDEEWQSTDKDTCNVTVKALDADRCYSFRARVTAKQSSYGRHAYPSDWSELAHRQRGEPQDSCQKTTPFASKFILVYGLVATLIVFLLLLTVWKLHRVKQLLVPPVPDPKAVFPGLFESHQGNFQEWIKDTQNIAVLNKLEDRERESLLEEALVVHLPAAKAETPVATMTDPLHPQTVQKEAEGDPSPLPCPPTPGKEQVSLGGFTFVVDDNAYVML